MNTTIPIKAASNFPIANICSKPTMYGMMCVSAALSYVIAEAGMNTRLFVVRDNASVIKAANGDITGMRANQVRA